MLPEEFTPNGLREAALAMLVLVPVVAFLVLRFAQKMAWRVVLLGALAGIGVYLWYAREELQDCVPTCACSFVGFDVQVPGCPGTEGTHLR